MRHITLLFVSGAAILLGGALMLHPAHGAANANGLGQARPTIAPLPTQTTAAPVASLPEAAWGQIRLTHEAAHAGMRTVVQWQGHDNRWYDVDGWRGGIDDAQISWSVAPNHAGTGPFRWIAYRGNSMEPLRRSPAFRLPGVGQTVTVALSCEGSSACGDAGQTP